MGPWNPRPPWNRRCTSPVHLFSPISPPHEVADADVVSLVEDSVTHRRWWVEQWPEGVGYLAGLVAQDVQDVLLEKYGRWPLCPVCTHGDPHALDVEPELGPDPHWVCSEAGVKVAAVGGLGPVFGLR